MVSIFLRLLEYHEGVLFMTTNRVGQFDEAFLSRISGALSYKEFDPQTRAKIWQTFFERAKVPQALFDDIRQLSQYDLNGRQIRTIIHSARAVAEEDGREMTQADLLSTVKLTIDFVDEVTKRTK